MVLGYNSPVGTISIEGEDGVLTKVVFSCPSSVSFDFPSSFKDVRLWLDLYFSGHEPGFVPKHIITCTPFEKMVYDILMTIPYGHVITYGEIARKISSLMSPQAVGGALGRNPLPLIIPCHRVVASNGKIGGFSAGVDIKRKLLSLEGMIR